MLAAAKRERSLRRGFTLDILGEAVISETEAEQHFRAYLDLLESIAPEVEEWPADPLIDTDDRGPIPRVNLSIKLSALDSQFDAIDPDGTTRRVGGRLRELFRVAQRLGAFINVDMESYEKKALTLHIFQTVLSEPEFRDWPDVGIVLQCYLRDTERDLVVLRDWACQRGTPVWVRLVKGAYWDYETIKARANGWPVPCFNKSGKATPISNAARGSSCGTQPICGPRSARTTSARSPTASPPPKFSSCRQPRSNCKCFTAWPTPRSTPSSTAASGCESTCPMAS